ncbi:MAG: 2-oxo acid dehydrogenase subunit E2 [Acidobacteria bacterium]|jgi:2-oxoglutarate dehydrogenase complex dihydrolipoamide succinyltransferase (E2) component|nr:2-oxo acid dehydrogenase subunit E2 [Acidobacteriota bacterium]
MAYVFEFPDVGEGIHEGRVVEWLVAGGDKVGADQPLVKVETDKAVVELPAPKAGTVLQLHVEAGADIHVGDPLVTIGEEGEEAAPAPAKAAPPATASEPAADAPKPTVQAVGEQAQPRRPLATPRTRALARRLGVDLAGIEGTGSGGRITDDDVERAAQAPAAAPARPAQPAVRISSGTPGHTADGAVERVSISHLRKVIAESMRDSKHTAAHVTHVDEADVTELMAQYRAMKPEIEERFGIRFTLLPLFVKALVTVLKDHPMFNAEIDESAGEILLKSFYNIGIAVDTPEGLIVPVVRNADGKDMVQLAAEIVDLAQRARERRLALEELRGGTCTITNIGPLGGVFATPIIRQPELAIIGLHKITERPVVVDGEIVVRSMMYLSVSFDHRWIDGAEGARFMTDLVKLVEKPGLLMARL